MSDPVSQTMKELLERMAASLAGAQQSAALAPAASHHTSLSTVPKHEESEDRLFGNLSALLESQLRSLEKRALDPLAKVVYQLEERCGRMEERCGRVEAMLVERAGKQTVTVDMNRNPKEAPSLIPGAYPTTRQAVTTAATSTGRPGEKLTSREKKQAAALLRQLDRIAPTVADYDAWLARKVVPTVDSEPRTRQGTGNNEVASTSSGETSADSDSDRGDNADYKIGAKYDPRDMPEDTGNQDRKKGERPAVKKVDIDKDPAAIRTLEPRPCHHFYLAKSGCAHGADCHHGHHYRLSKEHLRHMKQLVKQLPCKTALKTGVACAEGKDCIYPHKCPLGFNCHFGEKCRFFGIQGGHPYPGDFHTKQNYYDVKKESKEENSANGWDAEEIESSGVHGVASGW